MDQRLNIDTEGYLKVDNPKGYAEYDATPYPILEKMVSKYPFCEDDCFADFGCGKGRVLCFAAENGCRNVVGIEFNDFIFGELISNINRIPSKECIRVYKQKAETYKADSSLNKCFFYNPFYLKYFIKVYRNILRDSGSDEIFLFLYDAAIEYQKFLDSQKHTQMVDRIRAEGARGDLFVYRVSR